MKSLLQIALLCSLLTSCTKADLEEIKISKNLTKASASSAGIEQQPKIIITNYNYFNTTNYSVHIFTNNWNVRYTVDLHNDLNPIELHFDPALNAYSHDEKIINQIDLNQGAAYKDINFETEGNITYIPYEGEKQILIKNYKNIGHERCYSVVDPGGISRGTENLIIQTYRNKESPNSININIMPWASKHANLDGNEHFFNPKNRAIDIVFSTQDYYSTSCKDQKKIDDIKFIKKKSKPYHDDEWFLNIGGSPKPEKYYYYKNKKLERIDFNNGRSGNDINFYNSNKPGIVEYRARDQNHPVPIIDSNRGFVFGIVDSDGINGGSKNAEIKAFVTGRKEISIGIYK